MHFHFVATDHYDTKSLSSVESFVDSYPDFQTVWLQSEDDLELLLVMMGIHGNRPVNTKNTIFSRYWDLSDFKFPEFNNVQFDNFYNNWLQSSKRENSMNEYGSLIFLQGLSPKWNKLTHRFVIKESSEGT